MSDYRFSPSRVIDRETCHSQMSMAADAVYFAFYWCDQATIEAEMDGLDAAPTLVDWSMPRIGLMASDPIAGFDLARMRAIEEAMEAMEVYDADAVADSEDDNRARAIRGIIDAAKWTFSVLNEHDVRIVRWTAVLEHPTEGPLCAVSACALELAA